MSSIEPEHLGMLNWARWAHDCDPGLGVAPPPAFAFYQATKAWEDGWGTPGAPTALLPPIDERWAMTYEALLLRLAADHYRVLRRHYFERRVQPELELQAALRALADLRSSAVEIKSALTDM